MFVRTDAGYGAKRGVPSLNEAMRFAKDNQLLGIISSVEPFKLVPGLAQRVKEHGLMLVTYGGGCGEAEILDGVIYSQ